jgi:hypothetical protein
MELCSLRRWQSPLWFVVLASISIGAGCNGLRRPTEARSQSCDIAWLETERVGFHEISVGLAAQAEEEAGCIPQRPEESDQRSKIFVKVEFIRNNGDVMLEQGIVECPHPPTKFPCLVVVPEAEQAERLTSPRSTTDR